MSIEFYFDSIQVNCWLTCGSFISGGAKTKGSLRVVVGPGGRNWITSTSGSIWKLSRLTSGMKLTPIWFTLAGHLVSFSLCAPVLLTLLCSRREVWTWKVREETCSSFQWSPPDWSQMNGRKQEPHYFPSGENISVLNQHMFFYWKQIITWTSTVIESSFWHNTCCNSKLATPLLLVLKCCENKLMIICPVSWSRIHL